MSEETKVNKTTTTKLILSTYFIEWVMPSRGGGGIRKGMNVLGRATLISIVFLLRRWVWLTLSVVIGLGISLVIKMRSEKIYSSELTMRSNAVQTAI